MQNCQNYVRYWKHLGFNHFDRSLQNVKWMLRIALTFKLNILYILRHCLQFFLWLFSFPIDGVTFKCKHNNVGGKAKYCEFSIKSSNFDGFNLKMSRILTSFSICIQNLTELRLFWLYFTLTPSCNEIFPCKIWM